MGSPRCRQHRRSSQRSQLEILPDAPVIVLPFRVCGRAEPPGPYASDFAISSKVRIMMTLLRQNLLSGTVFYKELLSKPQLAMRTLEGIALSPKAPEPIVVQLPDIGRPEDIVQLLNRVFFRDEAHSDFACWALMRSVGRAEQEIVESTCDVPSGEEHITGQFFQAIREGLAQLRHQVPNSNEIPLSLAAANMTGKRAERSTGGDMGIIVRTVGTGGNSIFKSAVIQAKKANANGFANCRHTTRSTGISQIERLRAVPGLGHYIFYHAPNAEGVVLPPTMCSVHTVATSGAIHRFDAAAPPTVTAAAYIAYMLAGHEDSRVGALTRRPEDAAARVFAGLAELNAAENRITVIDTSTTGRMSWEQWRKYLFDAQRDEHRLRSGVPQATRSPGNDGGQTDNAP